MSADSLFLAWRRRELGLCLQANRWGRRPWVSGCFRWVSRAGDGPVWYALMVAVVLADGWNGLAASTHMAATGLVALLLYTRLKRHTRRPRPFADDVRIHALTRPLDEYSFPSGHTLHAVAFTLIAIDWYPPLAWLLVPLTLAIAASRVVLGLHYPSDVLAAGMIAGLLAGASRLVVWA